MHASTFNLIYEMHKLGLSKKKSAKMNLRANFWGSARDVSGSARDVPGSTRDASSSARDVSGSTRDVPGSARCFSTCARFHDFYVYVSQFQA